MPSPFIAHGRPDAPAAPRVEPWEPRLRYHAWIREQWPTAEILARQRVTARGWRDAPLISVVTPVYNTPPEMLRRMVRSVQAQTYPHWQLCLVDDGSRAPWIARTLERFAAADPRIRFRRRPRNGGIVAASNDALALATGDFVALLDDDDELDPRALYAVAREIVGRPETDAVYTDFDLIGSDGVRREPIFAPAWSPELLWSIPYVVHLTVYRRTLVERLGGFRAECEGSQDYDLALRVTAATDKIVHVPQVLYHWRAWARSAAGNAQAKPYAYTAGVLALESRLRDHPFGARRVEGQGLGAHAVRFTIKGDPLVSVIVPLLVRHETAADDSTPAWRSTATPARALSSLAHRTTYRHHEWLLVGPPEHAAAVVAALEDVHGESPRPRVTVVPYDGPPDAALAANEGARHARGAHLLFLGEDLEPLVADWLSALLEYSQQPNIGLVGAKIYRADGVIWHAGIVVPQATPHRVSYDDLVTRNYLAVSGACLMTKRELFERVGGFQPSATVGCSDVDYGLRLHALGHRAVLTPHARLRHVGAMPPDPSAAQRLAFHQQWADRLPFDPYYNRNYRQDGPWFMVGLGASPTSSRSPRA